MKAATEYLWFTTRTKRDYINITSKIQEIVTGSGIREGIALVSAMHITAGVYVNDAEDGLIQDIDEWLEHLAPYRDGYRHHDGETNGMRIQESACPSKSSFVTNGALDSARGSGVLCGIRRMRRKRFRSAW
jgi:secondary thiamine-phosphate synthase enzyme